MREVGLLERPSTAMGTRICSLYDGAADLRRAAHAFLTEGARDHERLVYVADAPLTELAGHLLHALLDAALVDEELVHAALVHEALVDAGVEQ